METIKNSLLDLSIIVSNLSTAQMQLLTSFCRYNGDIRDQQLEQLIQTASNEELKDLITVSQMNQAMIDKQLKTPKTSFQRRLSMHAVLAFSCLFRLLLLQDLLYCNLTIEQLMKMLNMVPPGSPDIQLLVLQQFQQFLNRLLPESIEEMHTKALYDPHQASKMMLSLLETNQDQFMLLQPVKYLISLPLEDALKIHTIFPNLQPIQIFQLVQLLQKDPLDILEIRQSLAPEGWKDLFAEDSTDQIQAPLSSDRFHQDQEQSQQSIHVHPHAQQPLLSFRIKIIEQPADRLVYRRNLKPHPTLIVTGDERNLLGHGESLFLVPILLRCDTLEELADKLEGGKPQRVRCGAAIKFSRLKIQVTSHQMGEITFCLQIELRKYVDGNDYYQVMDTIQTQPFTVVSHTTLINPTPAVPTINEVIPRYGSTSGGDRVVLTGKNFVDSPNARIKFDHLLVLPIFHGTGTLICQTPKHNPGTVSVFASNDSTKWSERGASFVYQDKIDHAQFSIKEDSSATINISTPTLMNDEASATTNYVDHLIYTASSQQSPAICALFNHPMSLPASGYTLLHYLAASPSPVSSNLLLQHINHYQQWLQGEKKGADFFSFLNCQDRNGNTPLHWAVREGSIETVQNLLVNGANPVLQNKAGFLPLHYAICRANSLEQNRLITTLVKSSASSVHRKTTCASTLLHWAAAFGNKATLLFLFRLGLDINAVDESGESPLFWALREQQMHAVALLLRLGANSRMPDESGETPLEFASSIRSDGRLINLLEAFTSTTTLKDTAGTKKYLPTALRDHDHHPYQTSEKLNANFLGYSEPSKISQEQLLSSGFFSTIIQT